MIVTIQLVVPYHVGRRPPGSAFFECPDRVCPDWLKHYRREAYRLSERGGAGGSLNLAAHLKGSVAQDYILAATAQKAKRSYPVVARR